jgi:hypothetical protein
LSNFDNLPEWTISPGLSVTVATNLFTSGPASLKFTLDGGDNGLFISKNITEFTSAKENLIIQIRSTLIGSYFKLSFREDTIWYDIDVASTKINEWEPFEFNLRTFPFQRIDEIKLTVQNVTDPVEVYLDQLMYFGVGSEYYEMPLKSAEYEEGQGRTIAKLEFGNQVIQFSEKIAAMKNLIDKTRLLSKVR